MQSVLIFTKFSFLIQLIVPRESNAKEVLEFKCSHRRISHADVKVRTALQDFVVPSASQRVNPSIDYTCISTDKNATSPYPSLLTCLLPFFPPSLPASLFTWVILRVNLCPFFATASHQVSEAHSVPSQERFSWDVFQQRRVKQAVCCL